MFGGNQPVIVLNSNTKREQGKKVQLGNISAAKTVAGVIRTCLGPRSMLKMLMDPMGGIVMTNDGNAILREIIVQHPAAKSMIEISRTQDEEVGDGTTSVIILAGEMLSVAEPHLQNQMHPTIIIAAYRQALDDILEALKSRISIPVNLDNETEMIKIVQSCIGTKLVSKWSSLACAMALKAVRMVTVEEAGAGTNGRKEIDIKRYAKVEKLPGGAIEDSVVLNGVMINKDITHPKMRRRIENPRIILLDCPLEYKKGESMTNMELSKETDFSRVLELEEGAIKNMCDEIIKLKPDVVVTEKGISDLAQHYLVKAGVTALRRVKKTDNNRIARASGATIVNRVDELKDEDIGLDAGLFEIKKVGDEYFTFITECKNPKACTILLRGASKDILNEIERNLQDAMSVVRNVCMEPALVPGGGAAEMALAQIIAEKAKGMEGVHQWPYKSVAKALEVIPATIIQNCGANTIRTLTALRAKHATPGNTSWGINGEEGVLVDMHEYGIWEPFAVKAQVLKTAIETAILLLRIDDIVSGTKKQAGGDPMKPEDNPGPVPGE